MDVELNPNHAEFPLRVLVEDLFRSFAARAAEQGVELIFTPNSQLPEFIESDFQRIREILFDFLENALNATKAGIVDVSVELMDESSLRIEVNDSGTGMEAGQQGELF